MVPHGERIVNWALGKKGFHEVPAGSNDGPAIRSMLSDTAFSPGDMWCMFFAEAAVRFGYKGFGEIPDWITQDGSCANCAAMARAAHHLSTSPATGAIALFHGGPKGFHHAGIVIAVQEQFGTFRSCEGNTDSTKGVNGGEVDVHTHRIEEAKFVIW